MLQRGSTWECKYQSERLRTFSGEPPCKKVWITSVWAHVRTQQEVHWARDVKLEKCKYLVVPDRKKTQTKMSGELLVIRCWCAKKIEFPQQNVLVTSCILRPASYILPPASCATAHMNAPQISVLTLTRLSRESPAAVCERQTPGKVQTQLCGHSEELISKNGNSVQTFKVDNNNI